VTRPITKGSATLPFAVFLLAATTLGAAGCAEVSSNGLQQDVVQLRQDVNALMLSAHRGRGESETVLSQVERRSREQSAETSRQLGALSTRVDGLAAEVTRVSVRLDEISQRLEALSRQMPADAPAPRSGSIVVPRAPAVPPAPPVPAAPPAVAPTPTPTPPVAIAPRTPPAVGGSADASFQSAYLDYSKGLYPLAISGFRDVVRRFPDSPQGENAQYWIGEAHFGMARASASSGRADDAKRGLEQAVQEFRKLIVMYPRGSRVPTGLYKEALALVELKQTALAQARLQYLLDHFPQSEEALLAKERLAALKQ